MKDILPRKNLSRGVETSRGCLNSPGRCREFSRHPCTQVYKSHYDYAGKSRSKESKRRDAALPRLHQKPKPCRYKLVMLSEAPEEHFASRQSPARSRNIPRMSK